MVPFDYTWRNVMHHSTEARTDPCQENSQIKLTPGVISKNYH